MKLKKLIIFIFFFLVSSIISSKIAVAAEQKAETYTKSKEEKQKIWSEIAKKYGFKDVQPLSSNIDDGYLYVEESKANLLQGDRTAIPEINDYLNAKNQLKQLDPKKKPQQFNFIKNYLNNLETKKNLTKIIPNQYKIHLMPTDKNIDEVFTKLLNLMQENKEIQKLIKDIKIRYDYEKTKKEKNEIFPRIVIYLADGKENAQKSLDILYQHFENVAGLGKTPRYNARVSDLIYFAQGDGDSKNKFPNLFEKSSLVYYDKKIISPVSPNTSHYLKHPETKKDIK